MVALLHFHPEERLHNGDGRKQLNQFGEFLRVNGLAGSMLFRSVGVGPSQLGPFLQRLASTSSGGELHNLCGRQPSEQHISSPQLNQVLVETCHYLPVGFVGGENAFGTQDVLYTLCVDCLKHKMFAFKVIFPPEHLFYIYFDLVFLVVGRPIDDFDAVRLRRECFDQKSASFTDAQSKNNCGDDKRCPPNIWSDVHFAPPKTTIDVSTIGGVVEQDVNKLLCVFTTQRTPPVRVRQKRAHFLSRPQFGAKRFPKGLDRGLVEGLSGMLRSGERFRIHVLLHYAAQIVVELAQFRTILVGYFEHPLRIKGAFLAICIKRFKMKVFFANCVSFEENPCYLDCIVSVFTADPPIEDGNLAFTRRQIVDLDRCAVGESVQPISGYDENNSDKNNGSNGHNKTRNAQNIGGILARNSKNFVKDLVGPQVWRIR